MSATATEYLQRPGAILKGLFSIPFPIFILVASVVLGVTSGMSSHELLGIVSDGFGETLGYIALILLASFTLASAISNSQSEGSTGQFATVVAPLAGAAMVCPDTAYAALSPMAAGRKLSVLFGSYAGFKLLIPAGPAIVATMLGGLTPTLVGWGAVTFMCCWGAGLLFAGMFESSPQISHSKRKLPGLAVIVPFVLLIGLITIGASINWFEITVSPLIDFCISPTGALIIAAVASLTFVDSEARGNALESSIKRTAPLLLIIGAASAFGTMLVAVLSFEDFAQWLVESGVVIPALFLLAATLKTAKGSSMATFAGAGGLVAALLPDLAVSPEAATLALCAGAFVTIAPNDSLYWLVRRDAFPEHSGKRATWILAAGATVQGIVALVVVQAAVWLQFL